MNSPANYIDPNGMYPDSWQRPGETAVAYNIRMNSPELYNMMYSDGGGGSGGGFGGTPGGSGGYWKTVTAQGYSYGFYNEELVITLRDQTYETKIWVPYDAQGGRPDYYEQSFSEQGLHRSFTTAEGVGAAGGYFYALNGKVFKNGKGEWYVYAQASAYAPAAEIQADAITYYSKITVLENGSPIEIYSGNLQVWDTSIERIGDARYTYIGSGYMPLPTSGSNISIEISISYNMYQWWNGHASPNNPYIYTINF